MEHHSALCGHDIYPGGVFGPRSFINAILNNEIEAVYWFFFPLFSVYLAMPALSLLAEHKKVLWYMAFGTFLLVSVFPFVLAPIGIRWPGSISIPTCGGMLMFVIIGFLLSETELEKKQRYTLYALGAAAGLFRFAYTYLSSTELGYVDRTYFNYQTWCSVLLSIAVFVWFKQLNTEKLQPYAHKIAQISSCSFGVYLIHKPILDRFVMGILGIPMTSILLRTVGVVLLYAACIAIVIILKKIPALRNIVP